MSTAAAKKILPLFPLPSPSAAFTRDEVETFPLRNQPIKMGSIGRAATQLVQHLQCGWALNHARVGRSPLHSPCKSQRPFSLSSFSRFRFVPEETSLALPPRESLQVHLELRLARLPLYLLGSRQAAVTPESRQTDRQTGHPDCALHFPDNPINFLMCERRLQCNSCSLFILRPRPD